jgi:predicted acylesterase/phospholipase RssA
MASGANRGAYYAGFLGPLQEAGFDFELMAGVSAGGIAAAWFAAGDPEALVDSWRQADPWRIAPHPWLELGRLRTVDRLIQEITLRTMDLRAARTAAAEVVVAAARVVGPGMPLPKLEPAYFSNRSAADDGTFGLMLRATAFVPYINGLRESITIDGERFLDGGLVHRVPLSMIPENRFDELWVAACSPNGLTELENELRRHRRRERLVVVTPSEHLPVGRWTMEWSRIRLAVALGAADIANAIAAYRRGDNPVAVGSPSGMVLAALGS